MTRTSVDWPQLLADMQWLLGDELPGTTERVPCGVLTLARHLEVSRGAVRNWLADTEPAHSQGEALIRAWVKLSGKPATDAPLTRPTAKYTRNAAHYA